MGSLLVLCVWSPIALHQALPMGFLLPQCSPPLEQTSLGKPGRRGGMRFLTHLQGSAPKWETQKWVWSPWLTPQIELNFTVISYIGRFFFCGGGLIPDYLVLCSVCSQTLFYLFYDNCQEYICLLWCEAWSTEKERSFILFWVFCDRSVQQSNTVKKMSKKQSWVYSFIHVGIPPGKEMSVYGDAGLRPAVCSWDLLCSSGWLRSFDFFALACLRLGVQVVTTMLCYTAVALENLREQIRSTWDRPEEEQNCVFVRIKRLWPVLLSVVSSLSSVTFSVYERLRLWYHFLELEKETNVYWDLDF